MSTQSRHPGEPAWDYIVVGAGSAGCVIASRLSENPDHSVLLIESGPDIRRYPSTRIPIGYARTFYDEEVNWKFFTEPESGLNGRNSYWPRGRVLGGSGSINAMVFCRGQQRDYDEWEALGADGWGWSDVLEYFKKIECVPFSGNPLRGNRGPITITTTEKAAHNLNQYFLDGCGELGFAVNPDYNADTREGVGYYQTNINRGFRVSSYTAYLDKARKRKNLTILTNADVLRLTFEGKRCTGVLYRHNDSLRYSGVSREVVLSAGAIGSPVILQRSGVGPANYLRSLGIDIMEDLPQVGWNLQDHLGISYYYQGKIKTLNDQFNSVLGRMQAGLAYFSMRRGPVSTSINQSGGFVRSSPKRDYPNIQLYLQALSYLDSPPGTRPMVKLDRFSGFSIGTSQCRPTSRGRVFITSGDLSVPPVIKPNYLSTQHDLDESLESVRLIRQIASTESMRSVIECEIRPGESLQNDDELLEDYRNRSDTVFHPSCTCRIGKKPNDSVVNPRLLVHGLDNVRVIDASVFPVLPSGNINATAIMVGEKGSDLLLADAC
ncbi:MAG: NAD(P)-binding protein [Gammaproteobacteria bacterium]|nr:NAD(P)-binding protein [Gammaproteobacteria bacterium]